MNISTSTIITIVSIILIILIGIFGYNRINNLEDQVTALNSQLSTAVDTINNLQSDIKNIQKVETERVTNTVEYNNTVREIIKESDPIYINSIKDDPLKYQEKLNADFSDIFKKMSENTK